MPLIADTLNGLLWQFRPFQYFQKRHWIALVTPHKDLTHGTHSFHFLSLFHKPLRADRWQDTSHRFKTCAAISPTPGKCWISLQSHNHTECYRYSSLSMSWQQTAEQKASKHSRYAINYQLVLTCDLKSCELLSLKN